jgi:hypothetical protein
LALFVAMVCASMALITSLYPSTSVWAFDWVALLS